MMRRNRPPSILPHLLWVDNLSATDSLPVTSRFEVTRELRKLDWHVTLVLAGSSGQQFIRCTEVLCISKPQLFFFGYCMFHLRLLRLLAYEWTNIDVILFPQMVAPWVLPLRLVRRLRGMRRPLLVMDIRDLHAPARDFDVAGLHLKNRLKVLFDNFAHRLANRWADGQTAITQRMVDLVQIPSQHLWGTWPSGVNLVSFAPAQADRRWPLPGEPIHLVYIGELLHERNLLPLCQAVEEANATGMTFILSLIGDGESRVDLERFALQTAGRIRVISPVPHDQIPEWLAQAHIGVTSIFHTDQELFQASSPIKLFEYMAAGLPILGTRSACHTDVVGNGEYAFWVEKADVSGLLAALRLVWQNRDSLSKMGSHAAIASQAWTWQESARKLKAALEYGMVKQH